MEILISEVSLYLLLATHLANRISSRKFLPTDFHTYSSNIIIMTDMFYTRLYTCIDGWVRSYMCSVRVSFTL